MARVARFAVAVTILAATAVEAQGVRITGTTALRYLELRPMLLDSIPADSTTGTGMLRETSRGIVAFCGEGAAYCRYRRTADGALSSLPLIQDLEASVWGLGEGIRAYAHVRGRLSAGSAPALWPQGDDAFDLLAAYVEVDRGGVLARLGRQWIATGLGMANFDGGFASWRVPALGDALTIEAWAGRSLMQGLHEPLSGGAVAAFEELAPDRDGVLLGAEARWRPRVGSGVGVAYQRELRTDRAWLYSERMSADASWRVAREGSVDGALELDLSSMELNEARLGARLPVRGTLAATAEVRRYRPFFELWTIWGAFTPVGFTEATAGLAWSHDERGLSAAVDGGWRTYDETDVGVDVLPMKSSGWRLGADAQWRVRSPWTVHASWQSDIGFGASRTDVDVGARWQRDDDAWLGARVSAFQSVFEFRVGTGRVIGLGVDGGVRLRDDLRLSADAAFYQHRYGDQAPATVWGQRRAALRVEWTVGGDPGMRPGSGAR